MSFPVIATSNTTSATSASGGLSVNMPSGIAAGDLLMVFVAHDMNGGASTISASAGWSDLTNSASGTVVRLAVFARIAAGGDTCTITSSTANDVAFVAVRITGHRINDVLTDIYKGTATADAGADSSPNPPNCTTGNNDDDYLWLECFAADDDDNTATYWSTSYSAVAQAESAQSTSSCMMTVGQRNLRANAENPGVMAMAAAEEWVAQTFAIRGAYTTDSTKLGRPKYVAVKHRRRPIMKGARRKSIAILAPAQTALSTSAIAHSQSLADATITEHAVVSPAALAHSQSLAVPTISEAGVLAPQALSHTQSLADSSLVEHAVLAPAAVAHAQSLENSSVTPRDTPDGTKRLKARYHTVLRRRRRPRQKAKHFFRTKIGVIPESIGHSQSVTVPTATEHAVITPQAITHQQIVPATTATGSQFAFRFGWRKRRNRHVGRIRPKHHIVVLDHLAFFTPTITPQTVDHAQSVAVATIAERTSVVAAALAHAQSLDTTTLVRKVVAEALSHDQQLQDSGLVLPGALVADDILHLVSLPDSGLSQASGLVAEAIAHGHTVAVPVLVEHLVLVPEDIGHAQAIEEPIVAWLVLPEAILHAQSVEATTLNRRVVPAALVHAPFVADAALVVSGAMAPDSIRHGLFVQDLPSVGGGEIIDLEGFFIEVIDL